MTREQNKHDEGWRSHKSTSAKQHVVIQLAIIPGMECEYSKLQIKEKQIKRRKQS